MHGASGAGATGHAAGKLSVPLVVASAVVAGVGIFGMAYWLITFDWLYFLSAIPFAGGCYLLFTRATGVDRA